MQKKLIAAAIAGLASAGAFAQSNVEIYGIVDLSAVSMTGSYSGLVGGTQTVNATFGTLGTVFNTTEGLYNGVAKSGHSFSGLNNGATGAGSTANGAQGRGTQALTEYGSRNELFNGAKEVSRIGFRGTEDLGGGLKAGFVIESSIAADGGVANGANTTPTSSILGDREATVSLTHSSIGRIKLGRQAFTTTDLIGYFDPFLGKGPGGIEQLIINPITSTTANNAIRFDTKLMDVNLTYEYAMSENSDRLNNTGVGSATALSAYYAAGPLALQAGHLVVRDAFNGLVTAATSAGTAALTAANLTLVTAGATLLNATTGRGLTPESAGAIVGGQYAARSLWVNHLGATYDFGVAKIYGQYLTTQSAKTASDEATANNQAIRAFTQSQGGSLTHVGAGEALVNSSSYLIGITVPFGAHKLLGSFVGTNDKRTFNMDARSAAIGYEYSLSKRTTLQLRGAKVYNTNGAAFGVIGGGGQAVALNSFTTSATQRTTAYLAGINHKF